MKNQKVNSSQVANLFKNKEIKNKEKKIEKNDKVSFDSKRAYISKGYFPFAEKTSDKTHVSKINKLRDSKGIVIKGEDIIRNVDGIILPINEIEKVMHYISDVTQHLYKNNTIHDPKINMFMEATIATLIVDESRKLHEILKNWIQIFDKDDVVNNKSQKRQLAQSDNTDDKSDIIIKEDVIDYIKNTSLQDLKTYEKKSLIPLGFKLDKIGDKFTIIPLEKKNIKKKKNTMDDNTK